MRRVRILDAAAEEASEAVDWYERQRPGLGTECSRAIEAVLDLLEDDAVLLAPLSGVAAQRGTKRIILKRF